MICKERYSDIPRVSTLLNLENWLEKYT